MKAARARLLHSEPEPAPAALHEVREEFLAHWAAMGTAWGINRTMAQIHALLMVANRPLSTDEVMADLQISRGNANTNLRDLVGWGLLRSVLRRGERKEFFEAEKDVWKMFCIIVRERRRREITPALTALDACAARTKHLRGSEAESFHQMMTRLAEFVRLTNNVMEKVERAEQSSVVPWALRLLQ